MDNNNHLQDVQLNDRSKKHKKKDKKKDGEIKCHFYVTIKKRYCKLIPKAGNLYCGEHSVFEENSTTLDQDPKKAKGIRVPCPYDTSHTVDLNKLEVHMKNKCNSRPKELKSSYFKRDANMSVKEPELLDIEPNYPNTSETKEALEKIKQDIMTEDGWSSGNARLSVDPGELRYTNKKSVLYGDLNAILNHKENVDETKETLENNENIGEKPSKKIKLDQINSDTRDNKNESLSEKLLLNDSEIEKLFETIKSAVSKEISHLKENTDTNTMKCNTSILETDSKEDKNNILHNIDDAFSVKILSHHVIDGHKEVKTNIKHIAQHSSLVGHLSENNLLSSEYRYIEFGAGKGELSRCVYEALGSEAEKTKFVLIDRKNFRNKWKGLNDQVKDSPKEKQTKETKNDSNIIPHDGFQRNTSRIQIDIRDLDISGLPELKKPAIQVINDSKIGNPIDSDTNLYPIVAYSKHLCGAATDLALRSLENYQKNGGKVVGIVFALCCHHVCKYSMYSNQRYLSKYLLDLSDGSNDLSTQSAPALWSPKIRKSVIIVSRLSSWAVCGWSTSKNNQDEGQNRTKKVLSDIKIGNNSLQNKNIEQKILVGRYCKRFFDLGRLEFTKNNLGFANSNLVVYTTPDISPENLALVAVSQDIKIE
ncbi:hypothetical protein BB559_003990 [Furculomyces boomerangus]|uniref:tRNA:m(4)X modification enzyme TRM13 n=1 Tax=Furculomyces boomerangus TaxID=61424 RepID=A0A2T9YHH6_9FUNG|nr:hypothetical protein BB559_003990 [Furculomyces boomerangus]